ncbi:hypothetical protein DXG01_015972 [Tephrocybe rancida]|nr:hypothetical protein DXG01_015972 [Tephrocybe rancida]
MHNVKRFLREVISSLAKTPHISTSNHPKTHEHVRPPKATPVPKFTASASILERQKTKTQAKYFIVDSVEALSKFSADAWDRVVCVIATGQAWQFRPYRWNKPIQLFHHGSFVGIVKGIYVSWANDPPNTKIKDRNVMELKIDLHSRHVDRPVVETCGDTRPNNVSYRTARPHVYVFLQILHATGITNVYFTRHFLIRWSYKRYVAGLSIGESHRRLRLTCILRANQYQIERDSDHLHPLSQPESKRECIRQSVNARKVERTAAEVM